MSPDKVLIVGGGISGLATAFYLGRAGIPSVIFEKSNRVGGLIKTERVQGCDLEAGPDSYITTKPAVAELAADLGRGLPDRIIGSNDSRRRIFVVRGGRLVPMPKAMSMMVPTEWPPVLSSPLLSLGSKFRLLRETLMRPPARPADFSVGELVGSHFGGEVLDYVMEPLLAGVYGGDSASLSAPSVLPRFVSLEQQFGSLIKGVRQSASAAPPGGLFRSFEGGMQTLTQALADAIAPHSKIIYGQVTAIEKLPSGWRLRLGGESFSSSNVVLACPAWASADLLKAPAPRVAEELIQIPYSSAVLAMLVYDQAAISHPLDGFGFLVPRKEPSTLAAATWVNSKFPSRIAEGLVALRGFLVGTTADAFLQAPAEEVVAAARRDFKNLMRIDAHPSFAKVHAWPRSMPQYVVGHAARIEHLTKALAGYDNLFLTGNYIDGVGIPDCVRRAKLTAKHIEDHRV